MVEVIPKETFPPRKIKVSSSEARLSLVKTPIELSNVIIVRKVHIQPSVCLHRVMEQRSAFLSLLHIRET